MRFFNFFRAEPDANSGFTEPQLQTWADGDTCREARSICKRLSNSYTYNLPSDTALRGVVGNKKADYLFGRFAKQFGWTTLREAQAYYDANKGTKGGVY